MHSDKKNIVLIVTHGKLAEEFVNSAKMIIGKVSDLFFVNFLKDMTPETLENKISEFIIDDSNIVIFTDLFGGTCLNVTSKFINKNNIEVISGVNMPILLEVLLAKDIMEFDELINHLKSKLPESIIFLKDKLNEKK